MSANNATSRLANIKIGVADKDADEMDEEGYISLSFTKMQDFTTLIKDSIERYYKAMLERFDEDLGGFGPVLFCYKQKPYFLSGTQISPPVRIFWIVALLDGNWR